MEQLIISKIKYLEYTPKHKIKIFMKRLSVSLLTILVLIISTTACDPSENASTGTLQVSLTDAPAAYESVLIDIEEVRVHINSETEDEDDGWRTINDQPIKVVLLNLTNGTTEILGEAELEQGTYNQTRIILGDENELVIDGQSISLTTPSAQ
jgi:hypothetical protein